MLVAFDLDDTLYLERDYVRSGFAAVGQRVEQRLRMRGFEHTAWALFERGERRTIFDQALARLGVDATPERIDDLVNCYRRHVPSIRLAPDADRALEFACAHHVVGLLTDGPSLSQWAKIAALELRARIDHVVVTDDHGPGFKKPGTAGFVALQGNRRAAECLYVADNPRKDFEGPLRLGWRTCRVRREGGLYGHHPDDPDWRAEFTVESLDALPGVVQRVLPG